MEGGAASFFTLYHHVSATLLHDAVYGRQTEPGSLPFFFRRKEGFKDSRLRFFVHTHARVADREHDVVAGPYERGTAAMTIIHDNPLSLDGERSSAGHRVLGIDHEIHQHLFQLTSIGPCVCGFVGEAGEELDIFTNQRTEQPLHVRDNRVYIDDFQFQQLLATEGEQLARQGGGAIGSLLNSKSFIAQRVVRSQFRQDDFRIAADHHQQIVEVVRNAAVPQLPFSEPGGTDLPGHGGP